MRSDYRAALSAFAERLRPDAEQMDTDGAMVAAWYARFRAENLHIGASERCPFTGREFCESLAMLGSVSGAFAFVALQQYVANMSLTGKVTSTEWPSVGVAFGHLRSPQVPAPQLREGQVEGFVPWMTGAGMFEQVVLGVHNTAQEEIFALVDAADRPAFRHTPPLALMACAGCQTVQVQIANLPLPASAILRTQPSGTMAQGDKASVLYQTPLMVGCVQACGQLIQSSTRIKKATKTRTEAVIASLTERIFNAFDRGGPLEGASLRAEIGDWSVRLARLAVMASGSRAIVLGHPAQRLYREALLYSLMAQTDTIVGQAFHAVLERA